MAKKYIDADRLKAEIEGIRWFPQISSGYNDGREDMKMMVLDIIDSLRQEQPEVDLDEETETWISTHIKIENGGIRQVNIDELAKTVKEWGKGIARHFYELGLKAKEENK